MIDIIGVLSLLITSKFCAIASPCPLSSASIQQNALGVSTKHITGLLNFSACFISLKSFLYPSGCGIPKLFFIFSSVSFPLFIHITVTFILFTDAIPPIIALSSL